MRGLWSRADRPRWLKPGPEMGPQRGWCLHGPGLVTGVTQRLKLPRDTVSRSMLAGGQGQRSDTHAGRVPELCSLSLWSRTQTKPSAQMWTIQGRLVPGGKTAGNVAFLTTDPLPPAHHRTGISVSA